MVVPRDRKPTFKHVYTYISMDKLKELVDSGDYTIVPPNRKMGYVQAARPEVEPVNYRIGRALYKQWLDKTTSS